MKMISKKQCYKRVYVSVYRILDNTRSPKQFQNKLKSPRRTAKSVCFPGVLSRSMIVHRTRLPFHRRTTTPIMYSVRIHVRMEVCSVHNGVCTKPARGWKAVQVFVVADSKSARRGGRPRVKADAL